MNGKVSAPALLLITGALLLSPARCSAEDVYKKMANDFAKYSTDKKVKNIAVVGFSRRAKTSREESEYISEKLMSCLVASGKVNLLERSQLDRVLEERRLGASGVAEEEDGPAKKIDASDAIIMGTIFGTGDKLTIIAKLIDPLTGSVLHTVEAQTDRMWEILSEHRGFEFEMPDIEVLRGMFGEPDMKPAYVDFRDAPGSLNTETCNSRRTRLAGLQQPAIEAKAKYWALRMRQPEFKRSALTRNPGAELVDASARKRFYASLEKFHQVPELASLSADEVGSIVSLAEEEKKVTDDCGRH